MFAHLLAVCEKVVILLLLSILTVLLYCHLRGVEPESHQKTNISEI
jgi:hypothetical protein